MQLLLIFFFFSARVCSLSGEFLIFDTVSAVSEELLKIPMDSVRRTFTPKTISLPDLRDLKCTGSALLVKLSPYETPVMSLALEGRCQICTSLHREAGAWSPCIVLPVMLGFSAGPKLPDVIRSMRHPGVCSDTAHFSDVKPGRVKALGMLASFPIFVLSVWGQINKLKLKLKFWWGKFPLHVILLQFLCLSFFPGLFSFLSIPFSHGCLIQEVAWKTECFSARQMLTFWWMQ